MFAWILHHWLLVVEIGLLLAIMYLGSRFGRRLAQVAGPHLFNRFATKEDLKSALGALPDSLSELQVARIIEGLPLQLVREVESLVEEREELQKKLDDDFGWVNVSVVLHGLKGHPSDMGPCRAIIQLHALTRQLRAVPDKKHRFYTGTTAPEWWRQYAGPFSAPFEMDLGAPAWQVTREGYGAPIVMLGEVYYFK